WRHIGRFAAATGLAAASPIFPILIGDEEEALAASARLAEAKIVLPAIRYPTVPRKKARLRVSLTAAATEGEMERLLAGLAAVR
ncbi:MAG TPA: hypothetical protein VIM58_05090, partial [Candidatus Methylacidiphilales bacterium]